MYWGFGSLFRHMLVFKLWILAVETTPCYSFLLPFVKQDDHDAKSEIKEVSFVHYFNMCLIYYLRIFRGLQNSTNCYLAEIYSFKDLSTY